MTDQYEREAGKRIKQWGIEGNVQRHIEDTAEYSILFSILAILPGQLLPYWGAVAQGDINPDTQRTNIPRYAKVWNWLFPKDTH